MVETILALKSIAETAALNLQRINAGTSPAVMNLPAQLGNRLEAEMLRTDPDDLAEFCDGIEVYADGQYKRVAFYESIVFTWKTNKRTKDRLKEHGFSRRQNYAPKALGNHHAK